MKPLLVSAVLLVALGAHGQERPRRACVVDRVSDGDTLRCRGGEKVRLLLVDAPETAQGDVAAAAKRALEELAPVGSTVALELDVEERDRYGRTLAYVFAPDGTMVNEELARRGLVLALTYPPNVRHVERIRAAISAAKEGRRGLWGDTSLPCSPRDFRAGRCPSAPSGADRQRQ